MTREFAHTASRWLGGIQTGRLTVFLMWLVLVSWSLGVTFVPGAALSFVHRAAWKGVVWGNVQPTWCRGGVAECNWQGIDRDAADIEGAGITWVGIGLRQGVPFSFYTRLLAVAQEHRLHVLFTLYKNDPSNDIGSVTQQSRYATWLKTAVHRYAAIVRYWEVGNEENLGGSWHIDDHATGARYLGGVRSYLHLLRLSDGVIKSDDPRLHVLIGGISESAMEPYLRALMRLGAAHWFDILAFHPYASSPDGVLQRLAALRRIVAHQPQGMGAKPIWITEIGFYCEHGWQTAGLACPETLKAQYLVETLTRIRRMGIRTPILWYVLHEAGNYSGYGLLQIDPRTSRTIVNPAWSVYGRL